MTCEGAFATSVEEPVGRIISCGPESDNGAKGIASANVIVMGSEERCEGADVCIGSEEDCDPYCRLVVAKDVDTSGKVGGWGWVVDCLKRTVEPDEG